MTKQQIETVQDLRNDINSLELMRLRLANQILKNEACIEEVLAQKEKSFPFPSANKESEKEAQEDGFINSLPTWIDMVRGVLRPGMNFTYSSLILACLAKYPSANRDLLRVNIYPTIYRMKKNGEVFGNEDGTMRLK